MQANRNLSTIYHFVVIFWVKKKIWRVFHGILKYINELWFAGPWFASYRNNRTTNNHSLWIDSILLLEDSSLVDNDRYVKMFRIFHANICFCSNVGIASSHESYILEKLEFYDMNYIHLMKPNSPCMKEKLENPNSCIVSTSSLFNQLFMEIFILVRMTHVNL